jgi:hypothetical protein
MLEFLLIVICVSLMSYLAYYWVGLTVSMTSETRQKRLNEHLDWQSPRKKKAPRRKQGLIRT